MPMRTVNFMDSKQDEEKKRKNAAKKFLETPTSNESVEEYWSVMMPDRWKSFKQEVEQ